MKIKAENKFTFEVYPNSGYAKIGKLLRRFRDSRHKCVEVVDYPHKNVDSCYESIGNQLRRLRIRTVKVIMYGDRIFLIKIEI